MIKNMVGGVGTAAHFPKLQPGFIFRGKLLPGELTAGS
jgi:hypothetical protein